MKKKDLLEKQLEGLFSDIVLPEPNARLSLGPSPTTEAALQLDQPSPISVPQAGRYRRLLNPNWLAWPIGALIILAFLLAGPRGWARPTDTATARATRATRAAAAHATPLSATATATPTTTASAVPRTPTVTGTPTRLSPTLESTPVTTTRTRPTSTPEPTPTSKPTASATATATDTAEPALVRLLTSTPPERDPPRPAPTRLLTATPPALDPPRPAPTRLLIPAINLEAPIMVVGRERLEVNGQMATTWAVPRTFAAGWHQTSAPPGQAGNTVLNGHQNIYGSVFKNLGTLEAGDEITIYVADTAYHYRVVEKHILDEEGQPLQVRVANARWIMPTDDERLTLVTCAPDSNRTQRLIVVAWPASE